MIYVEKREPDDEAWRRLRDRCVTATETVKRDFDPKNRPFVKEELYQNYMPFLLKIFNKKCAYCEETLSGQPGDVEHFRPKGRVCDMNFKPVEVEDHLWGRLEHPGYYALVYDWENLLPACADCNRFRYHGEKVGVGKADRFPVTGKHAVRPEQLPTEKPLIINPAKVDPGEHLTIEFDEVLSQWLYIGKTCEGRQTIDLFGLNKREALVQRRTEAYAEAENAFKNYLDESKRARYDDDWEAARQKVNKMWDGRDTFTAVRRYALNLMQMRYRRSYIDIPLPIPQLRPA